MSAPTATSVDAGRLAELISLTDSDKWRDGSCDTQATWIAEMLDRDPAEELTARFVVDVRVNLAQWAARERVRAGEAAAHWGTVVDEEAVMAAVGENLPTIDDLDHDVTVTRAPALAVVSDVDAGGVDRAAWRLYTSECRAQGVTPHESREELPPGAWPRLREQACDILGAYLGGR